MRILLLSFTSILISLFIPSLLSAQSPILTNQMISPLEGSSFSLNNIDTVAIGSAGENQVWDFSNLVAFDEDPLMYITTEETMHAEYFPGANVSSADENMCMFEYYHKSFEKLSYVGIYMDGLVIYYDDFKDVLHYPFEYGDQFIDSFTTTYQQSSATHHRFGAVNVEADAYGSLALPWGTLDNVLRVKTIEEMTDTFTFNNNDYEYTYLYETYAYYKNGIREPLLEFIYTTINEGATTLTGNFINETLVNSILNKEKGNFSLYPNPAKDQLTIESNFTSPINHCIIRDLEGRTVWTDMLPHLLGAKRISLNNLPSGIYFVEIKAGDSVVIQKFVKE